MKKNIIFSVIFLLCFSSAYAQSITVDAYKDSWVVLIKQVEEEGTRGDGWWSKWHDAKNAEAYFHSPHKFSNLEPGIYTIIVFLPASADFDPNYGDHDEASDGLGLENVELGPGDDMEFYFKKTDFKVWNCMSCPWLYVFDGTDYLKTTEVLKDVVGCERETTTSFTIEDSMLIDGKLRIRIQEEKDEITHIDRVSLRIGEKVYFPKGVRESAIGQLEKKDGNYMILRKGESVELEFNISKRQARRGQMILETEGYYDPDTLFLQEVSKKYQRTSAY